MNLTRLWLFASLKLENGRYRGAWFLIDTGVTASYLQKNHRIDVSSVVGEGMFGKIYSSELMGVKIKFREAESAANVSINNINLLGVNLLHQFIPIDDFLKGYLSMSKQVESPMLEP